MSDPVSITSFKVNGNHRTKLSFIQDAFDQSTRSKTVGELYTSLGKATSKLESLGIFSFVDAQIIVSEHGSSSIPHIVDVIVDVKEKNVPYLKVGTYFGSEGNNIGASAEGALRNPTGSGETVKVSYGHSSTGSREFSMNIHAPSVSADKCNVDATARLYEDNAALHFSSFSKNIGSLSLQVTSADLKHKLSLSCAVRDEVPSGAPRAQQLTKQWDRTQKDQSRLFSSDILSFPSPGPVKDADAGTLGNASLGPLEYPSHYRRFASPGILHSLSPSTKTNLEYTYTATDTRDSTSNPSSGRLLRGSLEVAVPPGTARFARMEVTAEQHISLASIIPVPSLQQFTASWCGSFGTARLLDMSGSPQSATALVDLRARDYTGDGRRRQLNMSDRYFLGGPVSMRGLHLSGTGPRSVVTSNSDGMGCPDGGGTDDALGGMTRVAGMLGVSAPLPFKFASSENLKTFVFMNYGALLPHSLWPLVPVSKAAGSGRFPSLQEILSPFRVSVGCGVSYALGPARLEVTYALPVRIASHDVIKPFQIGIGISMNT